MHIRDIFRDHRTTFSFEFFPPKTDEASEELVRFIRSRPNAPDPRGFGVGVAGFPEGHPTTPNRLKEMDYLKQKVDAGADYVCTQLFFDNRDFYDFRERCVLAGIRVPVIAGIMPITSRAGMVRNRSSAAASVFGGKNSKLNVVRCWAKMSWICMGL